MSPSPLSPPSADTWAFPFALTAAMIAVFYPTFDYDLYWHLANGREIWARQEIVQEDVFSFTQTGQDYRNTEWLAQLIFHALFSLGGLRALFLFKLAVTGSVAGLLFTALKSQGATPWSAAVWTALAVLTGFYRYIERPELFSLLGCATVVAVLLATREGRWRHRWLYLLPLLLAVWEWLHGAVFGMLLLVAAITAENAIARLRPSPVTQARAPWRATLNRAALLTLLLSLLNPYGLRNYGIFLPVAADASGFHAVAEWEPAGLRDYWLFFVLLAAGVGTLFRPAPERWSERLWLLGMGVLAWRFSRATGVFAIAAIPWLAFVAGAPPHPRLRQGIQVVACVLLAAGLYLHKFSPWSFVERRFGWGVSEEFLPAGGVRFAQDQGVRGPLYNTGHFGGYLAFTLAPTHKIFQYNLPKVWGNTYTDDPTLPDRHAIQWAIVGRSEELRRMFPKNRWAYLFVENGSILVARRAGENADLIRRFEVRLFRPGLPPAELARKLADAATGPPLAFEAAVYCGYRWHPALCAPLVDHLRGAPYDWRDQWLPRVLARQKEPP